MDDSSGRPSWPLLRRAHVLQVFAALSTKYKDQEVIPIPRLQVRDWPCIKVRGVMLDVSRTRVPTTDELFGLVDMLSHLKYNQLQLYTEHVFAYRDHPRVWEGCSPLTPEDVRALDAFCRARHVELVPNQNSLGHMHRWLKHESYRHLAECPGGIVHPFAPPGTNVTEPFSLCATDPAASAFASSLHEELRAHFHSTKFNVNLDEPFDLGMGRSRGHARVRGAGKLGTCFSATSARSTAGW